ncbi:HD domain-containing protein [candidate division TA06 bacterium]|uniref:HD domain-containing protein n=1 Tax=candidate division TA06 bacterium TaxID=2250710 RepID=A0A933I9Z0_UNCT6|nr:HD domain-containing protein [candidate division TA06 bacterium]
MTHKNGIIVLPPEHLEAMIKIAAENLGCRAEFFPLEQNPSLGRDDQGEVLPLPEFRRKLLLKGPKNRIRPALDIAKKLAREISAQEQESFSLTQEITERYEQLATLFEMSDKLGMAGDNQSRAAAILDTAATAVSASCGCLMLLEGGCRFINRREGEMDREAVGALARRAAERNKPEVDEKKHIALPLAVNENHPIGALALGPRTEGIYRSGDVKMLATLASYAALLLESGRLYEGLETLFFSTIKSMVEAIDAKDPRTRGHSERVRRYSARMAKEMGMSSQDQKMLELAALLHDLGKIGLPDSILNNVKSHLTEEQWRLVKQHPEIGVSILTHVAQLKKVLPAIGQHHERYDGSGYPAGVKGQDISLFARIIAVADAYDAMTTQRTYRPTFDSRQALAELKENSGNQFDPLAVELFIQSFSGEDDQP